MTREDDYRKNAAVTVELANRASTTRDKGRLSILGGKMARISPRQHSICMLLCWWIISFESAPPFTADKLKKPG